VENIDLTKDHEVLTERVRVKLCQVICKEYTNDEGVINVITLDPSIDQMVTQRIQRGDTGSYLAMDPNVCQVILQCIGTEVQKLQERGLQPILLTSPNIRPAIRKLTVRSFPDLVVLSWDEIAPRPIVNSVGMVSAGP
jgi:flagellar biosynthesis protein FlhA